MFLAFRITCPYIVHQSIGACEALIVLKMQQVGIGFSLL